MPQSKFDRNPLAFVDDSPIHGKGLFARRKIRKNQYIGTYEGRGTRTDGMHVLWLWDDETGQWDGIDGNNEMRFLNHSANPNADWWGEELYAIRDIEAGEEITFDYGEDWD